MSDNVDQRDDTKSHDMKLYASAIMAMRDGGVVSNVLTTRVVSLAAARKAALDNAKAKWPRREGWFDWKEATMEVPQDLLSNPPKEQRS